MRRLLFSAVLLPFFGVIALSAIAFVRGQTGAKQASDAPPSGQRKIVAAGADYMGTKLCQDCHGKQDAYHNDEYSKWKNSDWHAVADQSLDSRLAQDIERRLTEMMGRKVDRRHADTGCIQCHRLVENSRNEDFLADPDEQKWGVSCEACHGPAKQWLGQHMLVGWEKKTPQQKALLGMSDLTDPERRAAVCQSCHLGNASEGKLLTHDMYAAGHPVLANFELESFADRMPRHWEEHFPDKEQTKKNADSSGSGGRLLRMRNLLVSNLAALRQSIELMRLESWREGGAQPELARFDCFACHHDLKHAAQRRRKKQFGLPGMRSWSLPLTILTARHFAGDAERLEQGMENLHRQLVQSPFAVNPELAVRCDEVVRLCNQLITHLRTRPISNAEALALLADLCGQENSNAEELSLEFTRDFDSALAACTTLQIICNEVFDPTSEKGAKIHIALDELANNVGEPKRIIGKLPENVTDREQLASDRASRRLNARRHYAPEVFSALLKKASRLVFEKNEVEP